MIVLVVVVVIVVLVVVVAVAVEVAVVVDNLNVKKLSCDGLIRAGLVISCLSENCLFTKHSSHIVCIKVLPSSFFVPVLFADNARY